MTIKPPPLSLVETWLKIAGNDKYPEAQRIATNKIRLFFRDVVSAEIHVEVSKMKITCIIFIL